MTCEYFQRAEFAKSSLAGTTAVICFSLLCHYNGLWSFATADPNVSKVLKHLEEIFCFCCSWWSCSAWENCAFPEKIWAQSSKRWALGGGARRFNDKHVTQNGNNQALLQTRRQSLGRVTQLWVTHTKTHVHSGTHLGVQQSASWCQARGELLKHFEASVHGELLWMFTC